MIADLLSRATADVAAATGLALIFDLGTKLQLQNEYDQDLCPDFLVWLYPPTRSGETPEVGPWIKGRYVADFDVVMPSPAVQGNNKQHNINKVDYMNARVTEILNTLKAYDEVKSFTFTAVWVVRGAEFVDKSKARNGGLRDVAGWNVRINLVTKPQEEVDFCTKTVQPPPTLLNC